MTFQLLLNDSSVIRVLPSKDHIVWLIEHWLPHRPNTVHTVRVHIGRAPHLPEVLPLTHAYLRRNSLT